MPDMQEVAVCSRVNYLFHTSIINCQTEFITKNAWIILYIFTQLIRALTVACMTRSFQMDVNTAPKH